MKKTKTTAAPVAIDQEAPLGTTIAGTNYMLYFGHNRLCRLEEMLDTSFGTILDRVATDVDMRIIGACVQIGLEEHHLEQSRQGAAQVIEEAGIIAASAAVVKEMNATMMGIPARRAAMAKKAA